jgi:hypothetical protein
VDQKSASVPTKDQESNETQTYRKPDWETYGQLHHVPIWRAVALMYDAAPEPFMDEDGYFDLDLMPDEMGVRLEIVRNQLEGHSVPFFRVDYDEEGNISYYTMVQLKPFGRWAEQKMGWKLPADYPRYTSEELAQIAEAKTKAASASATRVRPTSSLKNEHQIAGPWPWGTYETKLLRNVAAAVQEFWTKYEPGKPRTAPTNAQVIKWLCARNVSQRNAEIIATVIRADGAPRGPRPL